MPSTSSMPMFSTGSLAFSQPVWSKQDINRQSNATQAGLLAGAQTQGRNLASTLAARGFGSRSPYQTTLQQSLLSAARGQAAGQDTALRTAAARANAEQRQRMLGIMAQLYGSQLSSWSGLEQQRMAGESALERQQLANEAALQQQQLVNQGLLSRSILSSGPNPGVSYYSRANGWSSSPNGGSYSTPQASSLGGYSGGSSSTGVSLFDPSHVAYVPPMRTGLWA